MKYFFCVVGKIAAFLGSARFAVAIHGEEHYPAIFYACLVAWGCMHGWEWNELEES